MYLQTGLLVFRVIGGILKWVNVLLILKDLGIETEISFNKHDPPHDANAYHRSRKTAVQLLKKQSNCFSRCTS